METSVVAEQTDELGLEIVLGVEAVLNDEREDAMDFV